MVTKSVDDMTPDEIANLTDAQMEALINAENGETDDSDAQAEQAAPSASKEEVKKEDEPIGILAKDGKSIIPIEVLQREREKALQATRTAEELTKTLQTTQAELEALRQKANEYVDLDGEKALSDEELDALAEDLPEVADKIRALQAIASRAESVIKTQQAKDVQNVVQDAIDSVPKLAYLQASNPELFEFATQIDAQLRQDPANSSLTMQQRFEKVVERLEKVIGNEITVQNAKKASIKVDDKTNITSLDDLPGGKPPVDDEIASLANKSPQEIAAMMDKMSESQIDSFLARATKHL